MRPIPYLIGALIMLMVVCPLLHSPIHIALGLVHLAILPAVVTS